MKNLLSCFIFLMLTITLQAQTLDCADGSATFSNITCEDDYLSFVVTSNNVVTLTLSSLPDGFQWSLQGGSLSFNNSSPNSLLLSNFGPEPFDFFSVLVSNVSNPLCEPFNLQSSINPRNSTFCGDLSILLDANFRAIPTLGQWGLIVLALILGITGISLIRRFALAS